MDTTCWFNDILSRPALAATNLLMDRQNGVLSAFASKKTTNAAYLISAEHIADKPIPDELVMTGGYHNQGQKKDTIACTIELKTGNALTKELFSRLLSERIHPATRRRIAIPFIYPGSGTNRTRSKLSKIIFQVRFH